MIPIAYRCADKSRDTSRTPRMRIDEARPLWKRATLFSSLDLGWVAGFQVTGENVDPDPRSSTIPPGIGSLWGLITRE